MRFDHLHHHYEIDRRQLLSGAAKLGAGAAVAMGPTGLLAGGAGAESGSEDKKDDKPRAGDEVKILGKYNDDFDVAGALDGTWAKETSARYGKDDERGAVNEITPRKTARALKLIPKRGIRIGEGIRTNSLAAEGVHEFVYCYMPQYAWGSTAGNTAPMAMTRG